MHDSQHDRWCAPIAANTAEGLSADQRRAIESCAECGPRIAALRALRAELDRAGDEQRDVFADAQLLDEGPNTERFEARLRELAQTRATVSPWRRRLLYAAAAAVVGALGVWVGRSALRDEAGTDRGELGDETVRLVSPLDTLRSGEPFAWEGSLPPGGEYVLHAEVAEGGQGESFLFSRLTEPRWIPTDEEFARLPNPCVWFVERIDPAIEQSTFSETRVSNLVR